MVELSKFIVLRGTTIHGAMKHLDQNARGILLVVDDLRQLVGTITDGDIRRGILAGISLDAAVDLLFAERENSPYPKPITAREGTPEAELLHLMSKNAIRAIPILDNNEKVLDIIFLNDLVKDYEPPIQAMIMAGGDGNRLRPLTENVPKPMLPVGEQPLLEIIIDQLRRAGISRVNLSTHYKSDMIRNHFKDGANFGVEITYVPEKRPLGTAGALSLLEENSTPLLVINGDILTGMDFRTMMQFHREHRADMTVAVRQYDLEVPYGVLECEGHVISRISEKPKYSFFVNAGIYLLEPMVHQFVPRDQFFNMTDLIETLIGAGRTVVSFPIVEYWLDIGRHDDYRQAQEDFKNGRISK